MYITDKQSNIHAIMYHSIQKLYYYIYNFKVLIGINYVINWISGI